MECTMWKVDGVLSSMLPVVPVPQGSILGALLFLLYLMMHLIR